MAQSPLVGRAAELAALRRLLDRLEQGGGGIVFVQGEPGIGKTRLAQELQTDATARGLATLWGACAELQRDLPFAAIADALAGDELERATVHELFRGRRPRAESEGEHRVRVLHALEAAFQRACDRRATVLVLEDLQWADQPTLLLVERLSRRCAHLPLMLLLTLRPYPVTPPLQALLASLQQLDPEHLSLAPLPEDEVTELVELSLGAEPGTGVLRAVSGAAGNPLFVGEVLATLKQEGTLEMSDGVVDAAHVEIVQSLRLAILRRLGFLPARCIEVLRVASLLGSEFEVRDLSVATGTPATELLPVLDEAIDSNIVRESGSRLAFRHDLVREAIYNDRPLAMRRALHDEIARKLRDAEYPPMAVAAHLLRGAARPDREGIEMLRVAARECTYHDPGMAVQLLERTAALIAPDDESAVEVKAELAKALIWSGRWTEGERIALELAESDRQPVVSHQVLEARVQAAALSGILSQSIVEEVGAAARAPGLDPGEAARLLTIAAQAAAICGDLGMARALATEAVEATRRAGDQVSRCEALILLSHVDWHEGRPLEGLAAAEEAVALAGRLAPDLGADVQLAFMVLAVNLSLLGRYEEAIHAFRQGMEQAERADNVWVLGQLHQAFGVAQFYAGSLDTAEGEFEASLGLWQQADALHWGITQQAWLGRIAVHRGDLGAARRFLAPADAELPPGTDWSPAKNIAVVSLTRALAAEAEGDVRAAFDALEQARSAILRSGAAYFNLRIGPELVRFAVALGEHTAAKEMTLATEEVASMVGTSTAQGQALRCRGLLERDAALLLEAVAAHKEGPSRVEAAGAAEEAAAALASDDAESAVGLLREALAVWEGAGASHDSGRVLARLRKLGERPGKRGRRRRAETGWAALTDSERRVLDLVRAGLTYREVGERLFISRRTVETHVTRLFTKLGVNSRAELAALLIDRAGVPENAQEQVPEQDP